MKTALTIGGSDPTGGAGIQADLKTFKSFGLYGFSVPTALTAQNTEGVTDIHEVSPDFFSTQLDTLLRDIHPGAFKTGMLGSHNTIKIITEKTTQYSLKNLVIDPVTVSSTGVSLVTDKTLEMMKDSLFPLAKAVTPNIYEASLFTGITIEDVEDMKKAAVKFLDFGAEAVIITGGHFKEKATDLLFDGKEFLSFQRKRLDGEYHGTGCALSSAITSCLALGYEVREAAAKANEFVWYAIQSAMSIGKGMKILNI
jgi:hydroxymethylpyrimidine/phosphomethylpyrimidine kinase